MASEQRQQRVGQRVNLPGHFDEPAVLEEVLPLSHGYKCCVRLPNGALDEAVISEDEAATLPALFRTDAEYVRLPTESARIRLAYSHDRQIAEIVSGIRSLPHQVESGYQRILP